MRQRRLQIGVDFDDVVFDLNASMISYLNEIYNTKVTYETYHSFFIEDVWGISIEDAKRHVNDFVMSSHHRRVPPVPHVQEVTSRLCSRHDLHVVTGRCLTHKEPALVWVEDQTPDRFRTFICTNHFSDVHKDKAISKAEACMSHGIHVLIEDAPIHAIGVSEVGIPVLLFDRPWNKELERPGITRVHSWHEVEREIQKLSEAP